MILESLIKYGPVAGVATVAVANNKTAKNKSVASEAQSLRFKNREKVNIYNKNNNICFSSGTLKNKFNGAATATPATPATLPSACPLVDGGICPPGCRFETKLMVRMLENGTLPDPKIGCPLRGACGLFSEWPRADRQPLPLQCLGHDCQHVARDPETAALRCEKADAEVIGMAECPMGRWSRGLPKSARQTSTPYGDPGDCECCSACDKTTMMCHHTAFFEHKAGRGVPCAQIRANCPRMGER
ncbi:hypothetical protein DESC_810093 [Desulfosarcina cetonica]|nr:hypothetical protein DESC_810093 [Desulfosarcina cetonica]